MNKEMPIEQKSFSDLLKDALPVNSKDLEKIEETKATNLLLVDLNQISKLEHITIYDVLKYNAYTLSLQNHSNFSYYTSLSNLRIISMNYYYNGELDAIQVVKLMKIAENLD